MVSFSRARARNTAGRVRKKVFSQSFALSDKTLYLCSRKRKTTIMATLANRTQMKGVFVNVPAVDWSLFRELARKFGWQTETREQLLDRFASSRPSDPGISEEEIMDEVRAVRYTK